MASPLSLDWSTATGASVTGNRDAGIMLRVLTGGANAATGTFSVASLTGHAANASWGAITAAITPASMGGGGASVPQLLPKNAYLGAKQRSTSLDTGVIEMGARLYVPQLRRFLQVDRVYGGSANSYDYTAGDPVNNVDLDGHVMCTAGRSSRCHSGGGRRGGGRGANSGGRCVSGCNRRPAPSAPAPAERSPISGSAATGSAPVSRPKPQNSRRRKTAYNCMTGAVGVQSLEAFKASFKGP